MNGGNLVEFDSPCILLQNENSEFTSMVNQARKTEYEKLVGIAKEVYYRNKPYLLHRSPGYMETNTPYDSVTNSPSRSRKYYPNVALSLESIV